MYHGAMKKYKYIAFYKPYGVLTQFTGEAQDKTLADFNFPPDVYAAGRLDKDSEGLLILTNDGIFNQKLTNPQSEKEKTYLVQVEKIPQANDLRALAKGGLEIKNYKTLPCQVQIIAPPTDLPPIDPPIRERKNIPTCWLELKICEGKNRQVRRMTAKIGYPTLRLIRVAMGKYKLNHLTPGKWEYIERHNIL